MNKAKISGKKIGIIAAAMVLLLAAVLLILYFTKSKESYRSIQIYDLEGSATIERDGIGIMEAVENLYLQSGDRICVAEESSMRLKLDDDKYIMVEESSVLTIVAEGTKEDSRTSIHLEQGAITNEIQNKLNQNSSYDVTTPNSVMAVRGTVFRVEILQDENEEIYTRVSTFEGKVGTKLIFPDGTMQEEVTLIDDGKEVMIRMDEQITEFVFEPQDIVYEEIPVECLEFLKTIMENGTCFANLELEELETLIAEKKEEVPQESETLPDDVEEESEEASGEPEEEFIDSSDEPLPAPDNKPTDSMDEEVAPGQPEQAAESVTVTFLYNGVVFGTQTVERGSVIAAPKLAPAGQGAWDFDFSQAITEDTIITWAQNM